MGKFWISCHHGLYLSLWIKLLLQIGLGKKWMKKEMNYPNL